MLEQLSRYKMALYFQKIVMENQDHQEIYKRVNVPFEQGLKEILAIHKAKEGRTRLYKFAKYIDNDFKRLFGLEDYDEIQKKK